MGVTERERTDEALDEAKLAIKEIANRDLMLLARAQVYSAEAVVRQIRDLDDDIYQVYAKIQELGVDLSAVIAGH